MPGIRAGTVISNAFFGVTVVVVGMFEAGSADMVAIIRFSTNSWAQEVSQFVLIDSFPVVTKSHPLAFFLLDSSHTSQYRNISDFQDKTLRDMGNDNGKLKKSTSPSGSEEARIRPHQTYSSHPSDANTEEERRKRMAAIEARLRAEASRGLPQQKQRQ